MDIEILQRQFARMGATLKVEVTPQLDRYHRFLPEFRFDIEETKRHERFLLTIREDLVADYDCLPLDLRPKERHLLLLTKPPATSHRSMEKFLCGHDERHWFVAGVEGNATNIWQAMESLKPELAKQSQRQHKVKPKNRHKRRNAGFIRQGEWFFIPAPDFQPNKPYLILRNEPIRRGWGKPHMVEELYRIGGEKVYVCRNRPNGITEGAYKQLIQQKPKATSWGWQVMRRNPQVYGRGKIRHPDHQTITLSFWHRIAMSDEQRSQTVAFLD